MKTINLIVKRLLPLIMLATICTSTQSAPPQSVSYQAYLKDNAGLPVNATENVTFRLYNTDTGGTALWTDTLTITITDGLFSVMLVGTPSNPFPKASMDNPLWLGVEINNDGEAIPRKALTSVINAFRAEDSDTLQGLDAASLDQSTHVLDAANPHNVTAAQLGAATIPLTFEGNTQSIIDVRNSSTDVTSNGIISWMTAASPTPGIGNHAAIEGRNFSTTSFGVGVSGVHQGSGHGVQGYSMNGKGVGGYSSSGTGGYFDSTSGYALITGDGNVGIGIDNPTYKLTVDGTFGAKVGGETKLRVASNGSVVAGEVRLFGVLADVPLQVRGGEDASFANGSGYMVLGAEDGSNLVIDPNEIMARNNGTASKLYLNGGGSDVVMPTMQITAGTDATYADGSGAAVIGLESGSNLVIDANEILARNNGVPSKLYLNGGGSHVVMPSIQITGGADIVEPFNVTKDFKDDVLPGMVMSIDIDNPGQLRIADKEYDRTVAGIVSGANGINPGLSLSQQGTEVDGTHPIALSGRLYALADASYSSIQAGDLLTTSNTAGHVMKATDYTKAHGAIIGKAMTTLEKGKGHVLVIVTLQ